MNNISNSEKNYPNDTIRLLLERASLRTYSEQPVPEEILKTILQAGLHAPSGGNLQPFSIIKIEDKTMRNKLADMCKQKFMAHAPLHLLFCIDFYRLEKWANLEKAPFTARKSFRHFWISFQDTIICAQNICTAADSLGLGSVYIGTVIELVDQLKAMFELPTGVFPVVLLCLGYPKKATQVRPKLAMETIVHNEKYKIPGEENLINAYDEKYQKAKIELSEDRLNEFVKVCQAVGGDDYARECEKFVKQNGFFNRAQMIFGLHYQADAMPKNNEMFLNFVEDAGFDWFKPFTRF